MTGEAVMNRHPRIRRTLITALLAPLLVVGALQGAETPTVQAVWKPVDLQFSYHGFTTSYSCDGLEGRMRAILQALGAHPQTRVSATGCPTNGPSDHAFVHISGAFPVLAADAPKPAPADKSRDELLKRLGVKSGVDQDQFPATEQVIDLSRERIAGLQPGDCELMEQLTREVFPKLGIKVIEGDKSCFPNQVPISTPRLKVSALIKAATPDEAANKAGGGKTN
jgi:hypothetical protein